MTKDNQPMPYGTGHLYQKADRSKDCSVCGCSKGAHNAMFFPVTTPTDSSGFDFQGALDDLGRVCIGQVVIADSAVSLILKHHAAIRAALSTMAKAKKDGF